MGTKGVSRRTFIKDSATAASALGVIPWQAFDKLFPKTEFRTPRKIGSHEKLNIACIGCGGQGHRDVLGVASENIVALCDVDDIQAEAIFARFPNVPRFKDFHVMLDEMDDRIDAVTVSTPDHTHFPAAFKAITMGKHVYVQKPVTHNIAEARALLKAARLHKVATQMGNQGHSNEGTRLLKEWIDADAIGDVREVHLWTDRPIWPQGMERPTDKPPVPKTLDWDLWLGTAPKRPYHPAYVPFNWRGWWDFGTGALGDMGCHIMDASFYALDLGRPTSVEAVTAPVNSETGPKWSIVTYEFAQRGNKPPVTIVWYEGGKKPERPKELVPDRELRSNGQILVGDKGTIMADSLCASPRILSEERMGEVVRTTVPKTLPRVTGGHYQNWIQACKGGPEACSNFEYAVPLSDMVLLGNLAMRTGRRIECDGERIRVAPQHETTAITRLPVGDPNPVS